MMKSSRFLLPFLVLAPLAAGPLAGCAALPPVTPLSQADQADLDRAGAYLNGVHTLQAHFLQERDDDVSAGTLKVHRPDQLEMRYDLPSQQVLRVQAGRVLFSDGATGAISSMPLDRTPLSLILADRIVFSGPVTVVSMRHDATGFEITMRSTTNPRQGQLTMQFSQNPVALRGLVMVDLRGTTTRLMLKDVQTNAPAS
jgi:outer membrane lipoprotein-sorting protein